jgi:uncharacterized protein YdiU (UPF0061 family)
MDELEKIVLHLIDREYGDVINQELPTVEKVVLLAQEFRERLTSLVANWIRVGFCQGNFNSDNCAAGGFTLDFGPFGFCDVFNPQYQPWTGGGHHFSFLNQPLAAERNFHTFCTSLRPLLNESPNKLRQLDEIQNDFSKVMNAQMEKMWAAKLGLATFNVDLFSELAALMVKTPVDYTLFFRQLSTVPDDIGPLKKSFYSNPAYRSDSAGIDQRWLEWLMKWKLLTGIVNNTSATPPRSREELSSQMKLTNPKYSLREWFVVPAYQQAAAGDYSLIRELQDVMTEPYAEQSKEVEEKYYRLKPLELFDVGGSSFYSCSS